MSDRGDPSGLVWDSFLSHGQGLLQSAAEHGGVIAIPPSSSWSGDYVPHRLLCHHVLLPKHRQHEYRTLSGRDVVVQDVHVHTGEGFRTPVQARILDVSTVSIRTARGELREVTVYFLTQPLEGGMDSFAGTADMSSATLRRAVAVLRVLPETRPVFHLMEECICSISGKPPPTTGSDADTWLRSVAYHAEDTCRYALSSLLGTPAFRHLRAETWDTVENLRQVFESFLLERIRQFLWPALEVLYREQSRAWVDALHARKRDPPSAFGVDAEFVRDMAIPLAMLRRIPQHRAPLAKLQSLRDIRIYFRRCAERVLQERNPQSDGAIGPEVFIGMFQYLLVHGHSDEVHLLLDEEETQGGGNFPLMADAGSSKRYFPRGSIQSIDVASAVAAEEEEDEEPLLMEPSGGGWADCFTWCAPCFVPPPRSRPRPGWIAGLLPPAMDDGEEPEMPSSSGRFLLEIGYMKRFHWVHEASSSQQVQCVDNPRAESICFEFQQAVEGLLGAPLAGFDATAVSAAAGPA